MPADQPPSLEDLARAAVRAWGLWTDAGKKDGPELRAMNEVMIALEKEIYATEAPSPRALDYVLTRREQAALRLACALLAGHDWPICDNEWRAVIDRARKLARLLLDGTDAR